MEATIKFMYCDKEACELLSVIRVRVAEAGKKFTACSTMKLFVVVLFGMVLLAGTAFADESEENSVEQPSAEVNCEVEKCNGQYEEYRCCGKCYQETCITNKIKCENKCTKGCYCTKGFIREYEGGKCMPKRLCQNYLRRGFSSG